MIKDHKIKALQIKYKLYSTHISKIQFLEMIERENIQYEYYFKIKSIKKPVCIKIPCTMLNTNKPNDIIKLIRERLSYEI